MLLAYSTIDKIHINNLFDLKGYNGKHLVREFPAKSLSTSCCKSYGLLGGLTIIPTAADDSAPAQLISVILLTNWCYTKIARQEIININICILYLILKLIVYKELSKCVDKCCILASQSRHSIQQD